MGIQYFPILKGYDKSHFLINSSVDWKSIPLKTDELDELTEQLGVTSLGSFVNITREESMFDDEIMEELEQDGELIDGVWYHEGQYLWSVEPQWFAPDQGLVTVRSLLKYLRSSQDQQEVTAFDEQDWDEEQDYEGVMCELAELEKILNRAAQQNKLFRIGVSA